MGWLIGMFRARWFPYVAVGITAIVVGATGFGYMKGYNTAERKMQTAMNKALKEQMKENQRQNKKDLDTLKETLDAEKDVEDAIDAITLPDIPSECLSDFHQWMLQFNDAVRASNRDTSATD